MDKRPAVLGGEPVFSETVPISSATLPQFEEVEREYRDIFSTGMVTNWKYVKEYEDRMASYLGVKHAIAVSSATSGLLLVLKCLELEGEVIVPSFTFAVTGHVLAWNRLRPVYADIDPDTCLLDPEKVEEAITDDTAAILGVHIWGNPCPADHLQTIADRHRLPLIFDAAQALGSRYLERPVAGFGRVQVFSCSPTKVVTSGEGGIVATNDNKLAEAVRVGRNYGDDGSYDSVFGGVNARMSELHAVVGLASLRMASDNIARRLSLIDLYKERLSQLPGISFQKTTPGGQTNGVYFTILVSEEHFGLSSDLLHHVLRLEGVDTRRYYYPPLHQQTIYRSEFDSTRTDLHHTEKVAATSLTLPMYSHMTEHQVEGVCDALMRQHLHANEVKEYWSSTREVTDEA